MCRIQKSKPCLLNFLISWFSGWWVIYYQQILGAHEYVRKLTLQTVIRTVDNSITMVLSRLSKLGDYIRYCYFQYTIVSCACMLEPKERYCLNSVIALVFSLIIYATVVYLPGHLMMMISFLQHILGITPSFDADAENTGR